MLSPLHQAFLSPFEISRLFPPLLSLPSSLCLSAAATLPLSAELPEGIQYKCFWFGARVKMHQTPTTVCHIDTHTHTLGDSHPRVQNPEHTCLHTGMHTYGQRQVHWADRSSSSLVKCFRAVNRQRGGEEGKRRRRRRRRTRRREEEKDSGFTEWLKMWWRSDVRPSSEVTWGSAWQRLVTFIDLKRRCIQRQVLIVTL